MDKFLLVTIIVPVLFIIGIIVWHYKKMQSSEVSPGLKAIGIYAVCVQALGVFVASMVAGYTFWFKDVNLPKSSVKLNMSLQLKKVGRPVPEIPGKHNNLIAVEMLVSATNPSASSVYLLPSACIAYGYKIEALHDNPNFVKDVNDGALKSKNRFIEKHVSNLKSSTVVAVGSLFNDDSLNSNETISRQIVFHVPSNQYDLIEVYTRMSTTAIKEGIAVAWSLDKDDSLSPVFYSVNECGERKELEPDKAYGYFDTNGFDLRSAESMVDLSLW